MNSEGLVGINVPNAFTTLFYLAVWGVLFFAAAQVYRRATSNGGGATS